MGSRDARASGAMVDHEGELGGTGRVKAPATWVMVGSRLPPARSAGGMPG
jgi:hypothetical protein